MTDIPILYVTERQVATMLGQTLDWLKAHAEDLERSTAFPKIDPVVGRRHRESVEIWARQRNLRQQVRMSGSTETNRENEDAF